MKDTIHDLTTKDLEEIARLHKKGKGLIYRITINTTKDCILRICRDKETHSRIDVIRSASINVKGVWFELINKNGKN